MVKNAVHKFRKSDDTLVRVLRNSAWLFTGNGVTAVLSFFYLAILTRTLGPSGFGQFVLIFSAVQLIAAFLRFQTWQTIVHYGVRYVLERSPQKFSSLAFFGIFLETTGALAGCFLAWNLIPYLGEFFDWDPQFIETTRIYAVVMLLCIKSSALGILRSRDRFRDGAFADAMIPIGRMIGALVVLFTGPSVTAFLIAWGSAELLSAIVFWLLVARHGVLHRKAFGVKQISAVVRENPGIKKFFLTTALTDLLGAAREHLVVLVIGFLIDARSAGLFRLANQLANAITRIAEIFAKPLFTELSRIHATGNFREFRRLFYRSLRLSVLSGAGIILLLVAAGQPMIALMAGPEFVDAYPLLVILGCATGLGMIGLGLDPLLQASGKPHLTLFIRAFALILALTTLYLLVPQLGATGAALALLIAALATLAILLITAFRVVRNTKQQD